MDICTFNTNYLNPLLEKLSKENHKKISHKDIDLLKFDLSECINKFINDLSSNYLHPQILLPPWISGNSKTIIDNTFHNIAEPLIKNAATGNITFSISDHFPQFFFFPDFFANNYTYKRNAEVLKLTSAHSSQQDSNMEPLVSEHKSLTTNDVNISFNNYLSKVNSLIMSHVPMKKLNKQQQKSL